MPRPRLIERLNASLDRNGTSMRSIGSIIRAGGFGKTTPLSEWSHRVGAHRDAPLQIACPPRPAGRDPRFEPGAARCYGSDRSTS